MRKSFVDILVRAHMHKKSWMC